MTDKAPMFFEARLGGLFPANETARKAMQEAQGRFRVTMTGGKANQRRRGLYWVTVALVTPILNDLHNMTLTDDDLHDIMRDKFGMFDEVTLPSGDVHKKRWSTSNRAMNEADRAEYLNKCFDVWSKWTGVEVATLRREAELQQ
jgi:hypothetical protein